MHYFFVTLHNESREREREVENDGEREHSDVFKGVADSSCCLVCLRPTFGFFFLFFPDFPDGR